MTKLALSTSLRMVAGASRVGGRRDRHARGHKRVDGLGEIEWRRPRADRGVDPVVVAPAPGQVCQLRIAVNDQKGQPPMFIDVATFGAQADACAKYLPKGRAIAVTGRLVYREWDDNGTRRSRHHIIGRVQFGGKPDETDATETADRTEEVATF